MNRRGFLTSLLAGVVAPMVLPGAGRRWVKQAGSEVVTPVTKAIINPAYVDAPYEVRFIMSEEALHSFLLDRKANPQWPSEDVIKRFTAKHDVWYDEPWPPRFANAACTEYIPPFKLV